MKKLLSATIAAVAVFCASAPVAVAGSYGSYGVNGYQYAVKYVCGTAEDNVLIHKGDYRTAINVVNANDRGTVVHALAVPTNERGEPQPNPPALLEAFTGTEIDCVNIRKVLLQGRPTGLLKGMVVLQSCRRSIDVSTVYTTASEENGAVVSSQVATSAGSRVNLNYEDCQVLQ